MSDNHSTSFQQRLKKLSQFITTKIKRHHGFDHDHDGTTNNNSVVARRHSSYIQPIMKDTHPIESKDGNIIIIFFFKEINLNYTRYYTRI